MRASCYNIFTTFGSLLALTIRFTLLAISHVQGFSLSNSLIKKLYSAEESGEDRNQFNESSLLSQVHLLDPNASNHEALGEADDFI